jgi:hypothetical protein
VAVAGTPQLEPAGAHEPEKCIRRAAKDRPIASQASRADPAKAASIRYECQRGRGDGWGQHRQILEAYRLGI